MLKFFKDEYGIISLTLSQLGLILASGILLAAVFSFIFLSDMHKNAELKNIATSFSTVIHGMDTRFFENTTKFWFPNKDYHYDALLSTEFITINAEGNWEDEPSFKERFLLKPWPRTTNPKWVSRKDLHNYLFLTYGHTGNESDPINSSDIDRVKSDLFTDRDISNKTFALNPIQIDVNKPVFVEKVFIHFDRDDDGWDKKIDEKIGFIILYQI